MRLESESSRVITALVVAQPLHEGRVERTVGQFADESVEGGLQVDADDHRPTRGLGGVEAVSDVRDQVGESSCGGMSRAEAVLVGGQRKLLLK